MPHWFLASGLAALLSASATVHVLDESEVPSVPVNADILEMQRERYQRLTVPVTIDGTGPYRFLIDTGAQATVLSQQLADRLQLNDRGKATLVGMSSSRPVETVSISEFGLGDRVFTVPIAPIVPIANIGGADGVLGLDTLQGQHVLLDFERNRIVLAEGEDARASGYEIIVRAQLKLGQLVIADARLDELELKKRDGELTSAEFEELMQLSLEAGTIKHPIPYATYMDDSFERRATPTPIQL